MNKSGSLEEKEYESECDSYDQDLTNYGMIDISAVLYDKKVSRFLSMRKSMMTHTIASNNNKLGENWDSGNCLQDIFMYVPKDFPNVNEEITFSIKNSDCKTKPVKIIRDKRGVFDIEFKNADLSFDVKQTIDCRRNYNFAFFSNINHGLYESFELICIAPR